jgi:uncharacterized protein (TIGR00725 family)
VKVVAVAGASECSSELKQVAYDVGYAAASKGFAVLTGGRTGVMEYALEGAKNAGGHTIGIIPSYDKSEANRFCDVVISTGMGHARNTIVASSGDVCVSVGGGFGTVSEIAIAKKLGRKVISFDAPFDHESGYRDREEFFIKLTEILEKL